MKKKMNKLLASTLTLSIVSAFSGCTSDVNKEDEHVDSAITESNAELNTESKSEAISKEETVIEKNTDTEENTENTENIENTTVVDADVVEETVTVETETLETETLEAEIIETEAVEVEEAAAVETGITADSNIITIAENGFKAMKERNTADTLKYTNLKEMYCWANNLVLDDEELYNKIDILMSTQSTSLGIVDQYGAIEKVKICDSQLLSENEIQSYNEFINSDKFPGAELVKNSGYKIEGAYRLSIEDYEYPVLVICADGEWKLDIYIDIMYDMYKMIYLNSKR